MEIIDVKSEKDLIGLKKLQKIRYVCVGCGTVVERLWTFNRRKQITRFKCRQCNTKQTNLERYNIENPMQTEQFKQKLFETNLEKYGNICSLNGERQIQLKKETWKSKYGVENPYQIKEIREKSKNLRIIFDSISFDSWWEVCFYLKNKDEGKNIVREPTVFEYLIGEKKHNYFVDFSVDGKYIEIKSSYWLSKTPEEKLKCLSLNNVLLISDKEIKPYLEYVELKYPTLKEELKC